LRTNLKSTGQPQNLVGWRYYDFLKQLTASERERFSGAFVSLLFDGGPSFERVERFSADMWRPMQRIIGGNPYAQMRMFPTFFLMMMNPRGDFAMRTDLLVRVGKIIYGKSLLKNERLSGSEYSDVLTMANVVATQLERWGWPPNDMLDVHSFLWIATRPEQAESE
jgi:hypothetical protein